MLSSWSGRQLACCSPAKCLISLLQGGEETRVSPRCNCDIPALSSFCLWQVEMYGQCREEVERSGQHHTHHTDHHHHYHQPPARPLVTLPPPPPPPSRRQDWPVRSVSINLRDQHIFSSYVMVNWSNPGWCEPGSHQPAISHSQSGQCTVN